MVRTITMPFAFSEGTDVLAAPADLVINGNWDQDGVWKRTDYVDQTLEPPENNCKGFLPQDDVYLEAYRIVSPFADGLTYTQPRIEFRVFGLVGDLPDGVDTHDAFGMPNLWLDYSAPWGEWQRAERFIPAWNAMGAPNGNLNRYLGIKTYDATFHTKTLDPDYNTFAARLEIQLLLRHTFPLQFVL